MSLYLFIYPIVRSESLSPSTHTCTSIQSLIYTYFHTPQICSTNVYRLYKQNFSFFPTIVTLSTISRRCLGNCYVLSFLPMGLVWRGLQHLGRTIILPTSCVLLYDRPVGSQIYNYRYFVRTFQSWEFNDICKNLPRGVSVIPQIYFLVFFGWVLVETYHVNIFQSWNDILRANISPVSAISWSRCELHICNNKLVIFVILRHTFFW